MFTPVKFFLSFRGLASGLLFALPALLRLIDRMICLIVCFAVVGLPCRGLRFPDRHLIGTLISQ